MSKLAKFDYQLKVMIHFWSDFVYGRFEDHCHCIEKHSTIQNHNVNYIAKRVDRFCSGTLLLWIQLIYLPAIILVAANDAWVFVRRAHRDGDTVDQQGFLIIFNLIYEMFSCYWPPCITLAFAKFQNITMQNFLKLKEEKKHSELKIKIWF